MMSIIVVSSISVFYTKSDIHYAVVKKVVVFVKQPPALWTDEVRANKTEGIVSLKVIFDKSGKTKNVEVLNDLSFGLIESAVNSAKLTEIEPYKLLDNLREVSTTINYSFKSQN